jgi:hypothetical protein
MVVKPSLRVVKVLPPPGNVNQNYRADFLEEARGETRHCTVPPPPRRIMIAGCQLTASKNKR